MTKKRKARIRKASNTLVKWIGSTESLILHTLFFGIMIFLAFSKFGFDKIMLVLTTIVSLEAIYLSIFIQMTVNKHGEELEEVSGDIDEIQEDIDEIQEDVDEIQEDVEEIQGETEDDHQAVNLKSNRVILNQIEDNLGKLIEEVIALKKLNSEEQEKNKKDLS